MKKIKKKDKEFLFRHAKRKARNELKRKEKRRRLKFINLSQKIKQKRANKFIKNPEKIKHEIYNAPAIFSLTEEPAIVISYFEKARKALNKDVPVEFNLKDVKQMGPETLTYLCALINNKKFTSGTVFKGTSPSDLKLKEMFNKAGFYNFVKPQFLINKYSEDLYGELIHRVTREKVKPELAGDVCRSAMKHTYDTDDYKQQTFYPILIECMANTWNHANYGEKNETYNWWLLAYKEPITKITKFCFLDLGVGVFESLDRKYRNNSLGKLMKFVIPANNAGTLLKIFQGEKKTSTGSSERGLGLNYIYSLVKNDKLIKNFTLLSNDIYAKIEYNAEDKIKKINSNFEGTMYYWELIPEYGKK